MLRFVRLSLVSSIRAIASTRRLGGRGRGRERSDLWSCGRGSREELGYCGGGWEVGKEVLGGDRGNLLPRLVTTVLTYYFEVWGYRYDTN